MKTRTRQPSGVWAILVWLSTLGFIAGLVDGELSTGQRIFVIVGSAALGWYSLHQPVPDS